MIPLPPSTISFFFSFDGEVTLHGILVSWIEVAEVIKDGDTTGVEFRSATATPQLYRGFLQAYTGYVRTLMAAGRRDDLHRKAQRPSCAGGE